MSANSDTTTGTKTPLVTSANGRILVNTTIISSLPPTEGRHRLRVETMALDQTGPSSKNPGTPMLKARLRIIGGPDDGKAVFQNFQLEGGFRFLFEQLAEACGLANRDDVAIEDFQGHEIEAETKNREYEGRTFPDLKRIFIDAADPLQGAGTLAQTPIHDYPF